MRTGRKILRHLLLWMVVCCVMYTGLAHASLAGISADSIGLPIDQIRISGNIKTQEKYIIKWTGISDRQILSIPLLNNALQ